VQLSFRDELADLLDPGGSDGAQSKSTSHSPGKPRNLDGSFSLDDVPDLRADRSRGSGFWQSVEDRPRTDDSLLSRYKISD